MWGLGTIVGPALGGLLAEVDPHGASVFHTFPYLLPNLATAAIAAVAMGFCHKFLPETRPKRQAMAALDAAQDDAGSAAVELDAAPHGGGAGEGDAWDGDAKGGGQNPAPSKAAAASGDGEAGGEAGDAPPSGCGRCGFARVPRRAFAPIIAYGLIACSSILWDEVFPLWCVAPRCSGGLGLSSQLVGGLLTSAGVALIVFQVFFFPLLARCWPISKIFKTAAALAAALALCPPLFARAFGIVPHPECCAAADAPPRCAAEPADRRTPLVMVLALMRVFETFSKSAAFTTVFMMINNSVDAELRGSVNGLSMGVAAGFRAVGPPLGAITFAWSLTNGLPPPLDVHLAFVLVCCVTALTSAFGCVYLDGELYDRSPEERRRARGARAVEPAQAAGESQRASGTRRAAARTAPDHAPDAT